MMFEYRAAPLRAIDGDTVVLLIDVGFSARVEESIRLANVMAPELDEPGGVEAHEFTTGWLGDVNPRLRWPLHVRTQPTTTPEPNEKRSFVRYVGEVTRMDTGESLNDAARGFVSEIRAQPTEGHT